MKYRISMLLVTNNTTVFAIIVTIFVIISTNRVTKFIAVTFPESYLDSEGIHKTNWLVERRCITMKCAIIVKQYFMVELFIQLYNAARVDNSFNFRLQNDTLCEQLLVASLEVNIWKFVDLPTSKQTIMLLTAMPRTVGVTDVSRISKEFLSDVQQQIGRLAYICEVERDDAELCKAMIVLYRRWRTNPLQNFTSDTLKYLKNGKGRALNDEDVEIVVDFFLSMYMDQLSRFIRKSCTNHFASSKRVRSAKLHTFPDAPKSAYSNRDHHILLRAR